MEVQVENVFAHLSLSGRVDIDELESRVDVESNLRPRFALLRTPHGTAKINQSGKVTVSGCRSMEDLDDCVSILSDAVSAIGLTAGPAQVSNILATSDAGYAVDLMALTAALIHHGAMYDPMIHPAVLLRVGGVAACVYSTGRITMTGASDTGSLEEMAAFIESALERMEDNS